MNIIVCSRTSDYNFILIQTFHIRPRIVKRKTNPSAHRQAALYVIRVPYNVASHLKVLIPVGTAMIIVVIEPWSKPAFCHPVCSP